MSIEAMKLALDALEDTHYRIIRAGLLDQYLLNRNFTVATALRERLAQPEQEPVAINWGAVHEKLGLVWYRELSADEGLDEIQDLIYIHQPQRTEPIQSLQCFHCQVTIETLNDKVMHLMAQRTWVGLTDEDMPTKELDAFCRGARWADTKLKQKNGYAEEKT